MTMAGTAVLFLVVFCVIAVSEIAAFQWSPPCLEDKTHVYVCQGNDVTLPWFFNTSNAEDVQSIQWFLEEDLGKDIIASFAGGYFFTNNGNLQLQPPAGLLLTSADINDTGVYSVAVSVRNASGFCDDFVCSASVTVVDPPEVASGNLTARLRLGALQNEATGLWSVHLECGRFISRGDPPVTVRWTTPSGEIHDSSSYVNGSFILELPDPPQPGQYSCSVDNTSSCQDDQALFNASVEVGCDNSVRLQAKVQELEDYQTSLKAEINMLRDRLANGTWCSECSSHVGFGLVDCLCVRPFEHENDNNMETICGENGARVLNIKTGADMEVIEHLYLMASGGFGLEQVWVGADDKETRGDFRFTDGTALPNNSDLWREGQPGNYSGEGCVVMDTHDGKFAVEQCYNYYTFVCHID